MTIDEMFNELENKVRDTYIVTLKYKYDFEKDYTIENHILEYDSTVDRYDWLDDWYEGQTDVEVLGYRLLSDIDNTKIEPCEDCISRSEALKHTHIEYDDDGVGHKVIYAEDIEDLPSVTPRTNLAETSQEWIPVSERLPEEYGNYLVTVEANDGTASIKVQMVDHYGPKWLHDEKTKKVIAWMPLPEPYKEAKDE